MDRSSLPPPLFRPPPAWGASPQGGGGVSSSSSPSSGLLGAVDSPEAGAAGSPAAGGEPKGEPAASSAAIMTMATNGRGGHHHERLLGGGGAPYLAPPYYPPQPVLLAPSSLHMVPAMLFQASAASSSGAEANAGANAAAAATAAAAAASPSALRGPPPPPPPRPPAIANRGTDDPPPKHQGDAPAAAGGLRLLLEASLIQEQMSQQQASSSPPHNKMEQKQPPGTAPRFDALSYRDLLWAAPAPAAKRKSLPLSGKTKSNNTSSPFKKIKAPSKLHSPSDSSSRKRKTNQDKKQNKKKKKRSKLVIAKYGIMDVLCGRGGLANRHDGNLVYRKVVESNKPLYRTLNQRLRSYLAESIVMAIHQAGGRFLEQKNPVSKRAAAAERAALEGPNSHVGTSTYVSHHHEFKKTSDKDVAWIEISFKKAVLKTSQALRETDKSLGRRQAAAAPTAVSEPALSSPAPILHRSPMPGPPRPQWFSLAPPSPMFPPPPLVPKPMTLPAAPSVSVMVLDATKMDGDHDSGADRPRSIVMSASTSTSSSSSSTSTSVAHYRDAAQEKAGNGRGAVKMQDCGGASGRTDPGRPPNVGPKMAGQDDGEIDESDDMGDEYAEDDDDEYSSTSSSSISTGSRTSAAAVAGRSGRTSRPWSHVAFVPVASSHQLLSQAFPAPAGLHRRKR